MGDGVMGRDKLPKAPADVLDVPAANMPDVIRDLMSARALSALVASIHDELRSEDLAVRARARAALDRLGFVE
jgi:hypothetical protein